MQNKRSKIVVAVALFLAALMLIGGFLTVRGIQNWRRQFFADEALWKAVENGDTAAAAAAMRHGADPNASGDAGLGERHTLITAQSRSDAQMVTFLLSHRANPTKALFVALDADEAKRLLGIGAEVNGVTDDFGMTVLGAQAAYGRPDIVRVLLAHSADPTAKDKGGETPMQRARYASGNHPEEAASYTQVFRLISDAASRRAVNSPSPQKTREHGQENQNTFSPVSRLTRNGLQPPGGSHSPSP